MKQPQKEQMTSIAGSPFPERRQLCPLNVTECIFNLVYITGKRKTTKKKKKKTFVSETL